MIQNQALCTNCYIEITDQACEKCLFIEVSYWVNDLPISPVKKRLILNEVRKLLYTGIIVSTNPCSLCSDEGPAICGYCFFYKAAVIIKKHIKREQLNNFLEVFNYRHFRERYVL